MVSHRNIIMTSRLILLKQEKNSPDLTRWQKNRYQSLVRFFFFFFVSESCYWCCIVVWCLIDWIMMFAFSMGCLHAYEWRSSWIFPVWMICEFLIFWLCLYEWVKRDFWVYVMNEWRRFWICDWKNEEDWRNIFWFCECKILFIVLKLCYQIHMKSQSKFARNANDGCKWNEMV